MLVVFSPIFVTDTKIIFRGEFIAPLRILETSPTDHRFNRIINSITFLAKCSYIFDLNNQYAAKAKLTFTLKEK